MFNVRYLHNMFVIGTVTKSALTSVLYRKALTVSRSSRVSTGQLVNLMAVDSQKIADVMVRLVSAVTLFPKVMLPNDKYPNHSSPEGLFFPFYEYVKLVLP